MRLPSKPVWVLIGAHTVSLTIGFWFLYQLVISSAEHEAIQSSWAELKKHADKFADVAKTVDSSDLHSNSLLDSRLKPPMISASNEAGLLLVDFEWKLLSSRAGTLPVHLEIGKPIPWQSEQIPNASTESVEGLITLPERGQRAALAFPIAEGGAYLVAYDPATLTPPWLEHLIGSLPLAAAIAFVWTWILAAVGTYLVTARMTFEQSNLKTQQEHDAMRSAHDLLRTRDAVIFGLAKLAESRDPETGHHLERISLYSTRLATALRAFPRYQRIVTPGFVRLLGISSVLHDIGKVGLEDTVLLKPGRLTEVERKKMQQHTLVAGACLKEIEQRLGASNFLQTAREIALHHHERWDGNGYPAGLAGEAIPLAARIVTVADVYDALSSKRVYKDAYPHELCVKLIREASGTQFDPELIEVFLSIESDFAAIARQFAANANMINRTSAIESIDRMTLEQEAVLLNVINGQKQVNSGHPTIA